MIARDSTTGARPLAALVLGYALTTQAHDACDYLGVEDLDRILCRATQALEVATGCRMLGWQTIATEDEWPGDADLLARWLREP